MFVVVGSTGMLGSYCVRYLRTQGRKCLELSREQLGDVQNTSLSALKSILKSVLPVPEGKESLPIVMINALGVIRQRKEVSMLQMIRVNGLFPLYLQTLSKEFNFQLVHISTDCVFNGSKGNYTENDGVSEIDESYAVNKHLGEQLLFNTTAKIIRTSIIGEEKFNGLSLVNWILSQKNKSCSGFTNHFWNGLTCLQLAKVIERVSLQDWSGIRHFYSPKVKSKYQLIELVNHEYKLNITIQAIQHHSSCNKTLLSVFPVIDEPELETQICEMREFDEKVKK